MPKFFDIHCHLNFNDFNNDREEVIERTLGAGCWMIIVGSDYESSKKAIEIAEKYNEGVYASVGIHPHDADHLEASLPSGFKELANHPKVVAIGECGLDYKFQDTRNNNQININLQKSIFKQQIELAIEVNKPLMIHCREAASAMPEHSDGGRAHNDLIEILDSYDDLRGNIHFFSGTWDDAQRYFDLGFTISFGGVITFKPTYDVGGFTDIVSRAPLDKIMAETDAPFVAPVPWRGKRNEPLYVKKVVEKMAEIKNLPYDKMAKITTNNALRLFLSRDSV